MSTTRKELLDRGVGVSETFRSAGAHAGPDEPDLFGRARASGPDPEQSDKELPK